MAAALKNNRVIYGLVAGACLILLTYSLYMTGVGHYLGPFAYLGYIALIALASAAALVQKKANGGWLEFREALKILFTVFVLALAIQTIFTWILLNVWDTHFREMLARASLERDALMLKRFGASQADIDRTIASEQSKNPFSLGAMSLGLAFSCIVHFIIALVLAAIIKKKKANE